MDCDWTCRYAACIMLIVISENNRISVVGGQAAWEHGPLDEIEKLHY